MKTRNFILPLLFCIPFLFQSCLKDSCQREVTYVKSTPIYKTYAEIRSGIDFQVPRVLEKPGKIYFYNDYIFINEQREGVHIIDNSNPESPTKIGFLAIPGNVDIAIRNQILYADNYTDLLTISLNDLMNPQLIYRNKDVFPNFGENNGNVLVYYHEELVTEMVDCEADSPNNWRDDIIMFDLAASNGEFNGGGSGIGGSFARFALYDDYLYTVDNSNLHVFSINPQETPTEVNEVGVGWQIETLVSYTDKLFIGSTTGMIIMDAAIPAEPVYLSSHSHWWGCDPVAVKGDYAYVTIRNGAVCRQEARNQMDLVNISNIESPYLEKSFEMENPHGLGIKDNTLFVCEGDFGLKVFDIEDPMNLDQHLLDQDKSIFSYDVIPLPGNRNILLLVGEDGFYQYNFDDPENLRLLSHISVKK